MCGLELLVDRPIRITRVTHATLKHQLMTRMFIPINTRPEQVRGWGGIPKLGRVFRGNAEIWWGAWATPRKISI